VAKEKEKQRMDFIFSCAVQLVCRYLPHDDLKTLGICQAFFLMSF
jgi:hypothetical protein